MPDPADFQPRNAIVNGGSDGIGRATCIALAEPLGLDLGFTYRSDEEGARATASEIEKRGRRAIYRQADFAREQLRHRRQLAHRRRVRGDDAPGEHRVPPRVFAGEGFVISSSGGIKL